MRFAPHLAMAMHMLKVATFRVRNYRKREVDEDLDHYINQHTTLVETSKAIMTSFSSFAAYVSTLWAAWEKVAFYFSTSIKGSASRTHLEWGHPALSASVAFLCVLTYPDTCKRAGRDSSDESCVLFKMQQKYVCAWFAFVLRRSSTLWCPWIFPLCSRARWRVVSCKSWTSGFARA